MGLKLEDYLAQLIGTQGSQKSPAEDPHDLIARYNLEERIKYFYTLPHYPQKSPEWHRQRQDYVTGSAVGTVILNSPSSYNYETLLTEKVTGISKFRGNVYTQWGNKFETIARDIYTHMRGLPRDSVIEFGLITDEDYPHLGISPDGVLTDRLLEIKCPFSRVINGKIKPEYAHQMQAQMLITKFPRCDFFECKFKELGVDDYYQCKSTYKGVFARLLGPDQITYDYTDCPLTADDDPQQWIDNYQVPEEHFLLDYVYWSLEGHNLQMVDRDPQWAGEHYQKIKDFHQLYQFYKSNHVEWLARHAGETMLEDEDQPQPISSTGVSYPDECTLDDEV